MKAKALGYVILAGCAALTAIIMDNHSTFITKQASLPPWAVELNQNIDSQVTGKIKKIVETKNNYFTLYIRVEEYLTKDKGNKNTKEKDLKLRVYKQVHRELINSYTRNTSITNDSIYLISFEAKKDESIEYLELITIDPYITE